MAGRSPTTRGGHPQQRRPANPRLRARRQSPRRTAATPPWRRPGRCSPHGGLTRAATSREPSAREKFESGSLAFALWAALPDAAQCGDESDHTQYAPGSSTRWVCVATRGAAPCAGARPRGGATPAPRPWTPRRGVTIVWLAPKSTAWLSQPPCGGCDSAGCDSGSTGLLWVPRRQPFIAAASLGAVACLQAQREMGAGEVSQRRVVAQFPGGTRLRHRR